MQETLNNLPTARRKAIPVLVADDDRDDRQLIRSALSRCEIMPDLHFVSDGQAALDFLRRSGAFAGLPDDVVPRPALVLLDLNMPRKDGRKVLEEIKHDPELCKIPVIIFTTSEDDADVVGAYAHGANSFITKPITFEGLVSVMREIQHFWFDTAKLPYGREDG
ncbi:MAG: response regulator [Armatimonadaceae bacterium]